MITVNEHVISLSINSLSQKYGPAEGSGSQTTRYFREQMRELEENNDQLKQEVSDLNRDLNGEKRAAEKVKPYIQT